MKNVAQPAKARPGGRRRSRTFMSSAAGPRRVWCAFMMAAVPLMAMSVHGVGNTSVSVLGSDAVRVVTDYCTEASTTAGIQEAIDSLPSGGGTVFVPPGIHVVHRNLYLRPNTVLTGAGKSSVIRKAPARQVMLAEDVKKGSKQHYVVVKDASGLKPGMGMLLGDLERADSDVMISKVEGNRVFLVAYRRFYTSHKTPWAPKGDLLVSRQACLCNAHCVANMLKDCMISNLAIDGNKAAQKVGGKELYKSYPDWWNRLRCVPYIKGNSVLQGCWLFDAAGVCVSLAGPSTVRDCEISGSHQGIHPGAGPHAHIVNNRIHDNGTGIAFCLGNYGLIVTGNHIYDNRQAGIGALGTHPSDERPGRSGDHFSIISDNIIFRNGWPGIQSGQGALGPQDFVITGNIVKDNCGRMPEKLGQHNMPAGIALYNAKRCLIANNRCWSEQDDVAGRLACAVEPGETRLELEVFGSGCVPLMYKAHVYWENWKHFPVRISDGEESARHTVVERELAGSTVTLVLDAPLTRSFAKGTEVRAEKTQAWGICAGGPEACDNVIANNICKGNALGGVLWQGRSCRLSGNIGRTVMVEEDKLLIEYAHPSLTAMTSPAPAPGTKPMARAVEREVQSVPVRQAPRIDGRPGEAAWQGVPRSSPFVRASGKTPLLKTVVAVCHDNRNLYVLFECADPEPGRIKMEAAEERDVFRDDAVAILLQPDSDRTDHFQFGVSAGGVKFDQENAAGGSGYEFSPHWQAAVFVGDTGWTAELAIPFQAMPPHGLAKGTAVWGANFGRVTRLEAASSAWSPSDSWHDVKTYGRLVLRSMP